MEGNGWIPAIPLHISWGRWPSGLIRCSLDVVTATPLFAFLEGPELIIILVILLVLFGGAKLPQLARSVGTAQREFKKGLSGDEEEAAKGANSPAKQTSENANTSESK